MEKMAWGLTYFHQFCIWQNYDFNIIKITKTQSEYQSYYTKSILMQLSVQSLKRTLFIATFSYFVHSKADLCILERKEKFNTYVHYFFFRL